MPCITDPPSVTEAEWLEHMLCQVCRLLTKEQMIKISGLDIYIGLFEWYKQHLMQDAYHYFKENQNSHLDSNRDQLSLHSKEYCLEQLERCKNEAKRLGLNLEVRDCKVLIS